MNNKKIVKAVVTKNITKSVHLIRNEAYSYAKNYVRVDCHLLEDSDLIDGRNYQSQTRAQIMNPETVVVLVGLNKARPAVASSIEKLINSMPLSNECYNMVLPSTNKQD
jgi:hypothetical protein